MARLDDLQSRRHLDKKNFGVGILWIFWGIVLLILGAALLIVGTVALAAWLSRGFRRWARRYKNFAREQLAALSQARCWSIAFGHGAALSGLLLTISSSVDLIWLVLVLLIYVFVVVVLTISLLAAFPAVKRLWDEPAVKLTVLSAPILLLFVARGFAEIWIGQSFRTSAANVPMAYTAATCFVLMLGVSVGLALTAYVFELALLIGPPARRRKRRNAPGRSLFWLLVDPKRPTKAVDHEKMRAFNIWLALAASLLMSMLGGFVGVNAALEMPSGFGGVVLEAIAFDFDATPADRCDLSAEEKPLTKGSEPFVKAIFLAGTQEKALLVRRHSHLFRAGSLREIKRDDSGERRMEVLGVVSCHSTTDRGGKSVAS